MRAAKVKRVACLVLAAACIVFAVDRLRARLDVVDRDNRMDVAIAETFESARQVLEFDGGAPFAAARERLVEETLRTASWSYWMEQEIREGRACWHCKGPHPWRWCAEHPLNARPQAGELDCSNALVRKE